MSMGNWVLPNPNQQQFDAITVEYPDSVTEVYKWRKGGVTGNIVVTITVIYSSSSKIDVVSITRS